MTNSAYNMELWFQPSVSFASSEVDHHEITTDFPRLNEFVTRSDGAGSEMDLSTIFDLALCQGALQLLKTRPYDRLLLPLSWRSCALDGFRRELETLLSVEATVRRRLILEFVAADDVLSIEESAPYIASLRRQGYKICLSHFGAGAVSCRFLRFVDVDYIKIDGGFLTAALNDPRQQDLLAELCRYCKELDYKTVASGIDDARQADMAIRSGIDLGQGHAYGEPQRVLSESGLPNHFYAGISMAQRTSFFLN